MGEKNGFCTSHSFTRQKKRHTKSSELKIHYENDYKIFLYKNKPTPFCMSLSK